MSKQSSSDEWGTASAAYAARTEYVTRPSAEQLIAWVNEESPLSAPGATALDNGAGSGVVTTTLRARFPNIPILAADLSPGMLEVIEKKRLSHVECQVLDATRLSSIADNTFTHSLSTFMIQFSSDPYQSLREMYRVTKPGGRLGLCMWAKLWCFDTPWEDTVRQFEPDYTYPTIWTPDWSDEGRLRTYVQEVGFQDVQLKTIRLPWDFESPEEYLRFYLDSQNPYFMSGYQPWWDKGMEGTMRPVLERIVKEKYNGAKNFDMEIFLIVARK